MVSTQRLNRRWLPIVVAIAMFWSVQVNAKTICTYVTTSPEHPVPLDERESKRQVQARVIPEGVAIGDKLVEDGKLAEAADVYYDLLFGGFWDKGVLHGSGRCLSIDKYQQIADKLRAVVSRLAPRHLEKGYFLDERHSYSGPVERGALRLFLDSNQYDVYIERAYEYAVSELQEGDIDSTLAGMVNRRLEDLERTRNTNIDLEAHGYQNDLTPLLDEELAAFDKLANFEEKLRAHLAPLYPKITDHLLAEEAKNFDDAIKTDGMISQGLMFGRSTDALERGIKRLHAHPEEVARLRTRANARGNTLMTRANTRGNALMTQKQYQLAEDYFEIAENEEAAAKADRLAEAQADTMIKNVEVSVKAVVEKMQKTDKEKAAFEDDTDEMAAEFGFDLED